MKTIAVPDPASMEALGGELAAAAAPGLQIHLSGDLGAGKTTLVRGFLHGLGYRGKVKSPTYTLVEPYALADVSIFHFDFYRVKHPAEVDAIGFRDYPGDEVICLIEWPEMAGDRLGPADLGIRFDIRADGRILSLEPGSEKGNLLISKLGHQA